MTRRALLSMLALAALDPERLIWRPGKKLISIPKPAPVLACELFRTKISASGMLFGREMIGSIYLQPNGSFTASMRPDCDNDDIHSLRATLNHICQIGFPTEFPCWPSVYSQTDFGPRPTRLWEAVPALSPSLMFRARAEYWGEKRSSKLRQLMDK